MIRKFNYTGRKTIRKSDVQIELSKTEDMRYVFDLSIDLSKYDFPPDALLIVEASRKMHRMRFSFGSIGNLLIPDSTELIDLPTTTIPSFTIKIIDKVSGLLLGFQERVYPNDIDEEELRNSLMPIDYGDLGHTLWQLDFSENRPILVLNKNIPSFKERNFNSDYWVTLIYPAAFKEILFHMAFVENLNKDEEWVEQWLNYIEGVLSFDILKNPENATSTEKYEWIDDVVDRFCNTFEVKKRFTKLSL